MRARWLKLLLVATPGCSTSLQAGAEVKTMPTAPVAVQGAAAFSAGLTDVFIPKVSLGAGATPEGRNITTLEIGFEVAPLEYESAPDPPAPAPKAAAPGAATREAPPAREPSPSRHRWSYRAGPTVGGVLAGSSGVYLGLRGGPTYALTRPHREDYIPLINLGLLAGVGVGGEIGGGFIGGVGLGISYDSHGSLHLPHGRPLRVRGGCVVAEVRRTSAWTKRPRRPGPRSRTASAPRTEGLPEEIRRALGEAWLREALLEHASIPAFERLARELEMLGAPRSLVRRATRCAHDEVHHARICFGFASAYLGFDVGPGPLDMEDEGARSLETLAVESLVDGCFGEGLSAAVAEVRSRRANDRVVARALARIAEDEARHAQLGWDVLAWCLAEGGQSARGVVRAALAEIERAVAGQSPSPSHSPSPSRSPWQSRSLTEYGVAGAADVAVATRTLALHVLTRAHGLLGAECGRTSLSPRRAPAAPLRLT